MNIADDDHGMKPVTDWMRQVGNVKFLRGNRDEMERAISAVLCVDEKIVKYCDQFFSWTPETTIPIRMMHSILRQEFTVAHTNSRIDILIPMTVKIFIGGKWHRDEVPEREERTDKALTVILEHFHPRLEIELTEIVSGMWILEETVCYFFTAFIQQLPTATNHWKLTGEKLMSNIEKWGYRLPEDFHL